VGGRRPIAVDFRLISATNEDLEARVAAGTFREDLFYRINAIPIAIPPLREREGDVALLAEHFLEKVCARERMARKRLSRPALARLEAHPWRGNVRELAHAIELAVLFSEGQEIGEEDLPRTLRPARAGRASAPKGFAAAVEDYEKGLLRQAIAEAGGVKAEAARRLGLDANQIKYLCRKFGL
jgi:DNA-binding NtrC family response regulator